MNNRIDPQSTAARLKRLCPLRPTLAIVLGSGLHHTLRTFERVQSVSCTKLPGFPTTGVPGHAGELCFGRWSGTPVLVLSGRAHFYEGYEMKQLTFPIRVLAAFGIRDLLLTNAAGAINPRYRPGEFMILTDHINLMGANPLRGAPVSGLSPFVDLTDTYSVELGRHLRQAARQAGITLHSGVYLAVSGPTYETPAEIRAYARLGADAVGMSTVPEAIVARQCGMRVAAVSCLTNLASGLGRGKLSHPHVLETSARSSALAVQMLEIFAKALGSAAHDKKSIEKRR